MDEDRLSPQMGRLIDAAKAAAAGARSPVRAEGWALMHERGTIFAGADLAAALEGAGAQVEPGGCNAGAGHEITAAAFAVSGAHDDTLLPEGDWLPAGCGLDGELPVAVKYLGRWVVVTLGELSRG